MRARCLAIDAVQVVDRRAEADDAGDVRRAGLELVRQRVVRRLLEGDRRDHVAAALVRRHRVEQRRLAVEHAGARRPEHLVAGEGVEVGIERLHVDGHVRRGLRAVDEHDRAGRVRLPHDLGDRVDRPERVRHVDHRDDASCASVSRRSNSSRPQLAAVVDRHDPQRRAGLLAHQLPGTMLEWCSIQETSTSSPGFRCVRPQDCATRLMPSVQPRVKIDLAAVARR